MPYAYRLLLLHIACSDAVPRNSTTAIFFSGPEPRRLAPIAEKKPHLLRRRRGADVLSDRARCCFPSDKKRKEAAARPDERPSARQKEPADPIQGPASLPRDQIGVEAPPTFALWQREGCLSFLRYSFSRLGYRGRALPSYMKVIGLGPRM